MRKMPPRAAVGTVHLLTGMRKILNTATADRRVSENEKGLHYLAPRLASHNAHQAQELRSSLMKCTSISPAYLPLV